MRVHNPECLPMNDTLYTDSIRLSQFNSKMNLSTCYMCTFSVHMQNNDCKNEDEFVILC